MPNPPIPDIPPMDGDAGPTAPFTPPPPAAPEHTPFTTMAPPVVVPALLVLGALLFYCGFYPDSADALFSGAQRWTVGHFDWFYTAVVTAFLLFLVLVAASRFGDIRLGPDDAVPEFSFVSWTAMLFAAGMGIGLMYFGVASRCSTTSSPPRPWAARRRRRARRSNPPSFTGVFMPGRCTAPWAWCWRISAFATTCR